MEKEWNGGFRLTPRKTILVVGGWTLASTLADKQWTSHIDVQTEP